MPRHIIPNDTVESLLDGSTKKLLTSTERTKLSGISTGATANSTDAQLRDRTTHTGVTPVAGIGSGTPAAGKYVDGGTGAWTTLPTSSGGTSGTAVTVDGVATSTLDISSLPTVYILSLSADVTTTSTTITNIAGLTVASLPVGVYVLDAYLINASSSTSAGPRFAIGGTATGTAMPFTIEMATSTTSRTTTIGTAWNTAYGTNVATASTNFATNIHARVPITAAGGWGIRWLVSAASTATLKAGSYIMITRAA